jgi:N-acetylmuramoyl-L-alanine amidase
LYYDCNVTQFSKINNFSKNSAVKASVTYKLPVEVVTYNDKSIRTTLGISDWRTAKRIEEYNKYALKEGLRTDNFLETKRLWVPWHELNCPDSKAKTAKTASFDVENSEKKEEGKKMIERPVPKGLGEKGSGSDGRIFSILGKKYQHTPLISDKLKGRVFYIVSGHGGPDTGARGKRSGRTLCEDEYAYDVSLRLLRLLLSHGATAYMIVRDPNDGIRDGEFLPCDEDEHVWGGRAIPREQKDRLKQRSDLINQFTAKNLKVGFSNQTFIEIHVDSRAKNKNIDVFFYYRPGSEPSHQLALKMQRTFQQKYMKKRGARGYAGTVTARNLFMLKETTTPKAVYVELANIQNELDQQRLVVKTNRQALANWICEAILSQ